MKKFISILLSLLVILSLVPFAASAAEKPDISKFEFPTPAAPVYMVFEGADRTATEGSDALYVIRQTDMSVLELSTEFYQDSDAFREKYGLYDFILVMQFDTSLDGTDNWLHTAEWDTSYYAPTAYEACPVISIGEDMMEKETIFDLYHRDPDNNNYSAMEDAIIHRAAPNGDGYTFDNYYFDYENHSLYVRCRYFMQWETYDGENIGETQYKYSEWSEPAIFGKNGTSVTPDEPTGYEAPVISNLKYEQPGERDELGRLTYELFTPESVWMAAIYYTMTGNGNFDTLETEISVNGSDWQPYKTVHDWADWGLSQGTRTAFYEEPRIEADSHIKLRIRYTGSHGVSEWSNVLELNDGGAKEVTDGTTATTETKPAPIEPAEDDKCSLCGFCPRPLGICIFIWLAILLGIIVIIVVMLLIFKQKKCKKCGAKLKKEDRHCPKCGTPKS